MRADLCRRAFRRAIEILGGKARLAACLGVDLECLSGWSDGSVPPPPKILQSVAQIVGREMLKRHAPARPAKKPARTKRQKRGRR
jgi:DNA-binding transcriptional regulator YdaS (Cro superfamily)